MFWNDLSITNSFLTSRMEPFLKQLADYLVANHKKELYDYWLVFPNKRTSLFFKKQLALLASEPLFVPPIFSIDEFITQFTPLEEIDQLGALFELYAIHKTISQSDDSFDDFYFWGEMISKDFDDIDKYLIDAKQLYTNLLNLKEIDQHFLFSSEDLNINKEVVKGFWSVLFDTSKVGSENFIKTWETLYAIYNAYTEKLKSKHLGYKGMLYRDAVKHLNDTKPETLPFKKVGFVGFNALTRAEEHIFEILQKIGVADFFWDYSTEMINSDATRAGYFLKRYTKIFPGPLKTTITPNPNIKVTVTAVPSGSAQTSVARTILENIENPNMETAVVLADENLLQTMLNNIPDNIKELNVTMGYPLKSSQVSSFLAQLMSLQQRFRMYKGEVTFNHKQVLQLFSNNILQRTCLSINNKRNEIIASSLFYLSPSFFSNDKLLSLIFRPVEQAGEVLDYLCSIFETILVLLNQENDAQDLDRDPLFLDQPDTEKELIYNVYTKLVRAKDLFGNSKEAIPGRDLMFKLIKRMVDASSIPFEGEPLRGIQLMGILETRNLEFKNLIVTSANEGKLPASAQSNSFIPFNLRKGFGLPTVDEHDAMYAYYFYRLFQRSENVHLIYDSTSQGVSTGEPSRYIYQLKYLTDINIVEQTVDYEVSLKELRHISIQKSPDVLERMNRYKTGKSALSASSLNAYLDCSLKFYLGYIERIREQDELIDDVDARIFGNTFHEIMELLYKPFEGRVITATDIDALIRQQKNIEIHVKQVFADNFFKRKHADINLLKGKLLIYVNVLLKYTFKVLDYDKKSSPFTYFMSEEHVETTLTLSDNTQVNLMAKIDRVDEINGVRRIIDYKSGSIDVNTKQQIVLKDLDELFKREKELPSAQKAIFQTLFYAMLYAENKHISHVIPVILPIRKLFGNTTFEAKIFTKKGETVSFDNYKNEFVAHLHETLEELFNPDIAFSQTQNINNCVYCDFKNICGR